jgi:hypothetical protein
MSGIRIDDETGYEQERPVCPLTHRDPEKVRYSYAAIGTMLCGGHYRGLDQHLQELPKLYALLAKAHLTSGISVGYGSRSAEKPLIIKEKVTEHRGRIVGALAFLTMTISEERGLSDPVKYEVPAMAQFLRRHLDWIVQLEWADDFASQVGDLHRDARLLVWPDKQDNRTRIPCPMDECDGMLIQPRQDSVPDDDKLPEYLLCKTCGMPVPPEKWRTLARQAKKQHDLVFEEDAVFYALALGHRLSGVTLRVWATREQISRYPAGGRTMYDLEEIECKLEKRVCLVKLNSAASTLRIAA